MSTLVVQKFQTSSKKQTKTQECIMGDRDVDKADGYNNVAIAIHHEFFRLSQSPTKKKKNYFPIANLHS